MFGDQHSAHMYRHENNRLRKSHFIFEFFTVELRRILIEIWTLGWCFFVPFCRLCTFRSHIKIDYVSFIPFRRYFTFGINHMLTDIRTLGRCFLVWLCGFPSLGSHMSRCRNSWLCKSHVIFVFCYLWILSYASWDPGFRAVLFCWAMHFA